MNGSDQYLRRIKAVVAGKVFEWDGSKVAGTEGIRVRFDVHQKDGSTPNHCILRITNLRDETTQPAFYENKEVTVSAGYDNSALIFKGQIRQARNYREQTTDKTLEILATDMGMARNTAMVNETLKAGHTYGDRVNVALKALQKFGVKAGYIASLQPGKKFPRAYAMHGMAKDHLRDIATATDSSWSIQNGVFQLLNNHEPKPGGIVVLNSETGLVEQPIQTIRGIEGRCLLNPRLVPGGLVKIDQKSIIRGAISPDLQAAPQNAQLQLISIAADGIYKLHVTEHIGDARGNEYYTLFIGVKRGDPTPKGIAARALPNPDASTGSGGSGSSSGAGSSGDSGSVGPADLGGDLGSGDGTI